MQLKRKLKAITITELSTTLRLKVRQSKLIVTAYQRTFVATRNESVDGTKEKYCGKTKIVEN